MAADKLPEPNYDEGRVGSYQLPDPLISREGAPVASAADWFERRRPELLRLFEDQIFGQAPGRPDGTRVVGQSEGPALDGAAIRRQVRLELAPGAPALNLLLYAPVGRRPVPAFIAPNFLGNHTVHREPGIILPETVFTPEMDVRLPDGRATEASRGADSARWPVERILARGYALATFHYGDVFPDRPDGRALGVQPCFDAMPGGLWNWGALATWAWAMSRGFDCLEKMPEIDATQVGLVGHSRHGKAALWAGALDPRFRFVIANNSGKGGASLMRRNFGETVAHLVGRYPHWFAPAYAGYAGREYALPVDQHMLIALNAPRPVLIASAEEDRWADPKGEFLAAKAGSMVYRLLGADGISGGELPPADVSVGGTLAYHLRRGGHGVTAGDWERFLDFADRWA